MLIHALSLLDPVAALLDSRIHAALETMHAGIAVVLLDDFDRENEADLNVSAERLTIRKMAMLIRERSGIVCLCLTSDVVKRLDLPPMGVHSAENWMEGCEKALSSLLSPYPIPTSAE